MVNAATPFRAERAHTTPSFNGRNLAPAPADNRQLDTIVTALSSTEPSSALRHQSDPLDLFGRFGESVKALERLSKDLAALTELGQGSINPVQRAAIDKELKAQKAEVARIERSEDFQGITAIVQDVSRRLQQGESRESIAAGLEQHTELLGSGFFELLKTAPASIFSRLSDGLAALGGFVRNEPQTATAYAATLNSIAKNLSDILRGGSTSVGREAGETGSDEMPTRLFNGFSGRAGSSLLAVV